MLASSEADESTGWTVVLMAVVIIFLYALHTMLRSCTEGKAGYDMLQVQQHILTPKGIHRPEVSKENDKSLGWE